MPEVFVRVGFTIILNGYHHLKHNDFADRMASAFDHWAIVEGAVQPYGSTVWCRKIPHRYHVRGRSNDGTCVLLDALERDNENIDCVYSLDQKYWYSKDAMVNCAADNIRFWVRRNKPSFEGPVFLWQVDADEQWTEDQMAEAEQGLLDSGGDTGMFLCDYYVGEHLRAVGEWGEGKLLPYRRLWLWKGQGFDTHEPPVLCGGNGTEVLLSQRFKHYAYWDRYDVQFKQDFYTGHDGILERWERLQSLPPSDFPLHISELITGSWGQTDTQIQYVV